MNSKMLLHKIDITAEIDKKQLWRLSEILSLLLSFGSEVPAGELRAGKRAFSMKSELEKGDDPVNF